MKTVFNILKKQSGFSLTELVIAVGIMGIVSLGVMELTNNQQKMQSFAKTKDAEVSLVRLARLSLLTNASCQINLQGRTVPSNIPEIVDPQGIQLLTSVAPNNAIGDASNRVVINRIRVESYDPTKPLVEGDNLVDLKIRTIRQVTGSPDKQIEHSFLMRVQLDGAGQIVRCHTAISEVSDNLGEEFCDTTNGLWDTTNNICEHSVAPACPAVGSGSDEQLLTESCLENFEDNVLDDEYINIDGNETVDDKLVVGTGAAPRSVTANGTVRVTGSGELCVNGNCRDFSQFDCSNSQVGSGVLGNGDLSCHNPLQLCGGTEYIQGFDGSGNRICRPLRSGVCADSTRYVRNVNADGSVDCAEIPSPTPEVTATLTGTNENYIRVIPASGSPTYRQDKYLANTTCPDGEFIIGASGTTPICGAPGDKHVFSQICEPGYAAKSYNSSTGALTCESVNCVSNWIPSESTVCSGESFTQQDGCGFYRTRTGTKNCVTCTDSSWSPATSTVCSGESFTQVSNCDNTRTATGTLNCSPAKKVWKSLYCGSLPCVEDIPFDPARACPFPSNVEGNGLECNGSKNSCQQNVGVGTFYVRVYSCTPE